MTAASAPISPTNSAPTNSAPANSAPANSAAAESCCPSDARVIRTRERVRTTVLDLIAREGHKAVTLARVATESGVGRSTLYRHWPDVRALLLDALRQEDEHEAPPLLGDLQLDLAVDLHRLRQMFDDDRAVARIVSLLEQAEFDDAFAPAWCDHQSACTGRIEEVLESARDRGQLPGDAMIDPTDALALLAGPLFFRRLISGQPVTSEFVDTVLGAFLRGCATDRSPTAPSQETSS